MKILVTGSNGFVGSALVKALENRGHTVVCAVRKATVPQEIAVGDIDGQTDWSKALPGVEVVVHLAAHTHDLKDTGIRTDAYGKINIDGTLALARAAQEAGVKRFIFMSSVKVMGEGKDALYKETDAPAPEDNYGLSKWEAEQGLHHLARGMEIVVLRPPLVYGPQVKANFLRLLKMAESPLPLPFGAIHNQRSMLYIENLIDAVVRCVEHPQAAGKTYLLSDGKATSVTELLRILAVSMQRPARLFPMPVGVLRLAASLLGKQKDVQRFTKSLAVDDSKIRSELGWKPPFSMEEGLARTARWHRESRDKRKV